MHFYSGPPMHFYSGVDRHRSVAVALVMRDRACPIAEQGVLDKACTISHPAGRFYVPADGG